jgi:ABC-type nitrate/sulfonate/bicarbonate transport system substrate-binding protein
MALAVPVLSASAKKPRIRANHSVRLGFIALNDCAPLVVAKELGFFERHGLRVTLTREVGWATIREKVLFGELDAAHAPAGMVVAATSGLGSIAENCLTALVLNLHGNAIVLSQRLHRGGVRDGHTLREHLRRKREPLTFGVVYQWSSHHVLLRQWFRAHGIIPEEDVHIVIVPPSQVFANLRAGHLDGYCVGEPWASLAVMQRSGWVVTRSAELAPQHPEKVLMVRQAYAEREHDEHMALSAALLEACAFCDSPANRDEVIHLLARREYVGAPVEALRMSMGDTYDFGYGRVEDCPGFNLFSRNDANAPTPEKAAWVIDGLVRSGLVESLPADLVDRCFRMDLHRETIAQVRTSNATL